MHIKYRLLRSVIAVGCILLSGCATAQRMAPHMGFGTMDIEARIGREDIVVLDTVEGESSTLYILLGLIRIIDDEKLQVLGIKFFKDRYVPNLWLPGGNTVNRAYYKALEATPDADAVLYKSWEHEDGGIPILWFKKRVTFKGKAVQLRPDHRTAGTQNLSQRPGFQNGTTNPVRPREWDRLHRGMTAPEVSALLGQPIKISKGKRSTLWFYPDEQGGYVAFLYDRIVSWKMPQQSR